MSDVASGRSGSSKPTRVDDESRVYSSPSPNEGELTTEVGSTIKVEVEYTNEDEVEKTPEQLKENKPNKALPAKIGLATGVPAQGTPFSGERTITFRGTEPTKPEDEDRSFRSTPRSPSPTCSHRSERHASSTISTSTDNSRGTVVGRDKIRCVDDTGRDAFKHCRNMDRTRAIQSLVAMLWPTQKEKYPYVALQGQRGACIARVFDHKNRLMFDEGVRWHLSSGDAIKELKYALEEEATRKGLVPETRHVRMPDSSGVKVVKQGKNLAYVRSK